MEAFERLARAACRALSVPVAYVSLADGRSQFVTGVAYSLPDATLRRETPLASSVCARAMTTGQPVLCADLCALADGPTDAVLSDLGVNAVAAVPLLRRSGRVAGCLCAADVHARTWTDADADALADLAASAASELALADATANAEERHHAEGAWRAAERALRRSEASYRMLMEEASDGICVADAGGQLLAVNAAFSTLVGVPRDALLGLRLGELLDDGGAGAASRVCLEALRPGESILRELRLRRSDGRPASVEVSARMLPDGRVQAIVRDISARVQREAVQRFLEQASDLLGATLDYEITLASLARLAVPALADWCVVYTLESDNSITRLEVAASDPEKRRHLERLRTLCPIERDSSHSAAARVIRTGVPELQSEVPERYLLEAATSAEHLTLLRALQLRSNILVPLTARGRTLGAMMFTTAESGRRYGPDDLAVASDLARRAALAMDNAQLYRQAQEARAATEAASGAKSDFLAVMSHELRTPLSGIIGYAELLADGITGPVTPAQQDQLARIRTCAGHLLGLIDEILAFARLESDRDEVRPDRVDVAATVRVAAAVVESAAAEKGLRFSLRAPEGITAETDPGKLGRILVNLLANAIKFTDSGDVTLDVAHAEGQLAFRVTDTGIGIPPEYHERIFEQFWQVESPVYRHAGGTGIGLSVVQRLTALLGGTIEVESAPGAGSSFTVRLPVRLPVT